MTIAPLPSVRSDPHRVPVRRSPTRHAIARRRRFVVWSKMLLPLGAVALLASIALWPEISRQMDSGRKAMRRGVSGEFEAGKLLQVRYRGVDGSTRPYTITADKALQVSPERVNLVQPKGDLTSENGSWTYAQSEAGVYMQHLGMLDMSGNVVVFRDNGVTLHTQSAALDLKSGAAAGQEATHAEGPFGTLDAQGFTLVDKGAVIQFQGASHLTLNGSHS